MNGAINDDLAKALGLLFFFGFFYAKPVRLLSWTIRSSTLATKGWWRVWYPVYFFHAELIVFCLLFYFEVIRCLNIVVPLGGVHSWFAATTLFQAQWNSCIRWWIHFFSDFVPWRSTWTLHDSWEGWGLRRMDRLWRHLWLCQVWIRQAPSLFQVSWCWSIGWWFVSGMVC